MQANPFHGRWRIVEMETWDQDYVDMEVPGYIELDKTGQLWIGREGGEEWSCLFDSLPPIHCVKVAVV